MKDPVYLMTKSEYDQLKVLLDRILSQVESESSKSESDWLSSKEAMSLLNVSNSTLWNYRRSGKITAKRINRKLYFNRIELVDLINSSEY